MDSALKQVESTVCASVDCVRHCRYAVELTAQTKPLLSPGSFKQAPVKKPAQSFGKRATKKTEIRKRRREVLNELNNYHGRWYGFRCIQVDINRCMQSTRLDGSGM
eukprot:scaffold243256_cov25-Prasinocladus_malaysianus.AAC.1